MQYGQPTAINLPFGDGLNSTQKTGDFGAGFWHWVNPTLHVAGSVPCMGSTPLTAPGQGSDSGSQLEEVFLLSLQLRDWYSAS